MAKGIASGKKALAIKTGRPGCPPAFEPQRGDLI
jgi:hypothetical protein